LVHCPFQRVGGARNSEIDKHFCRGTRNYPFLHHWCTEPLLVITIGVCVQRVPEKIQAVVLIEFRGFLPAPLPLFLAIILRNFGALYSKPSSLLHQLQVLRGHCNFFRTVPALGQVALGDIRLLPSRFSNLESRRAASHDGKRGQLRSLHSFCGSSRATMQPQPSRRSSKPDNPHPILPATQTCSQMGQRRANE
jgi:hypothetical protein